MQGSREQFWQEHLEAARRELRRQKGLPETPEEEARQKKVAQQATLVKTYHEQGYTFIACWYFGSKRVQNDADGQAIMNPLPRTLSEALQKSRVTKRFIRNILLPDALVELGYCLVALDPEAIRRVGGKTTVFYPLYQALRSLGLTPLKDRMLKTITPLTLQEALRMVGVEEDSKGLRRTANAFGKQD